MIRVFDLLQALQNSSPENDTFSMTDEAFEALQKSYKWSELVGEFKDLLTSASQKSQKTTSGVTVHEVEIDYTEALQDFPEDSEQYPGLTVQKLIEDTTRDGKGKVTLPIHLVTFNIDGAPAEKFVAELKDLNLRPLTLFELLTFHQARPDLFAHEHSTFGLGTLHKSEIAPRIHGGVLGWGRTFLRKAGEWDTDIRFAAVPIGT